MYTIQTREGSYKGERMTIKSFKTLEALNKFLNKGDNSYTWKPTEGNTTKLKAGKYAWAGQQWHNVKSLDPCVLAHI